MREKNLPVLLGHFLPFSFLELLVLTLKINNVPDQVFNFERSLGCGPIGADEYSDGIRLYPPGPRFEAAKCTVDGGVILYFNPIFAG